MKQMLAFLHLPVTFSRPPTFQRWYFIAITLWDVTDPELFVPLCLLLMTVVENLSTSPPQVIR